MSDNKGKITCLYCESQHLKLFDIINVSKKSLKGKPIFVEGGYEKNTFRSAHICQDCGRVSLYPVIEARS